MRIHDDERGIAMVLAVSVLVIVFALGVVAVELSIHNVGGSAFDRKRTQAIDAAEAGLDSFFSQLTTTSSAAMPCPVSAGNPNVSVDLPTDPAAHFDVYASFYNEWPPAASPDLTCAQVQAGAIPQAALVKSVGTAVTTTTPTKVVRTMESTIHLSPIYGGLNKAIFSDTQLSFQNKFTLNGNVGNDGDVYTNGNFDLGNNTLIKGTVYAQGSATIAQGVINANVWAGNAVSLSSGIQVQGNVTSSTSSITLSNNSTVFGNAKAGTTVSGGTVKGTITQNSPSGPPPQIPLPKYCWPGCDQAGNPNTVTQQAYLDAGYTVKSYTSCATAATDINNWFGASGGDYVVLLNGSTGCPFNQWSKNTINIKGNLAIYCTACDANGVNNWFTTSNNTTIQGTGSSPYTLYLVRPWQSGLACSANTPNFSSGNLTKWNNLSLFVYTPCRIDFANNNANGVNGQLIGGTVNITNQCTFNFVPVVAPGFLLIGYNSAVSYIREIATGS
jgi:cytoskeletal protein CcmA (bactofilin family)